MPKTFRPYALLIGGLLVGLSLAMPFLWPESQTRRRVEPPPNATVKWNETTNTPDWLDGPLPYTLSEAEQSNPELAARGALSFYHELFGIQNANAEFELVRIDADKLGQKHVRLQQVRDGVPVWSRVMLVHLGETQVLGINGDFQPDLTLSTVPAVTASEAESQALAAAYGDAPLVYTPSRLMIYIGDDGSPYLTWQVKINTALPGGNTAYFVDAVNGGVVHETPLTASDKYREVYDAQLKENLPGRLLASEGTVPRDPDGAAAYKNAGLVYDYWKNTFGRDSYDDNGGPIGLIVHSPELGNSYWNGQVLVFGDKDDYITNKDDALVLDIMGHEFTHAIVQYTADLVYETQSGALNESFADVFAVMIDRNDWHLFEDNSAAPPLPVPWLRDMQDPSLSGDYNPKKPRDGFGQPTFMKDYANLTNSRDGDWGGVHVNSGIPNHVLYLAATASSREATEQIWYRALSTYLTPKSDFADFAAAIQKSAADLYGANSKEANAMKSALVESGIVKGSGGANSQPTPPPTAAAQTTTQPTPAPVVGSGCNELATNGTFENGRPDPWVEKTNLNASIIGADFPHTGKKGAWLGGTDQESFQYVYQDIAIAANLKKVTLTYWHYLSENADAGTPDAVFDALLADSKSGDVLATLEELTSSKSDEKWVQSTIDLSQFAGKKVRLAFTANMVRGNLSNFFVDDVSVVACTSAAAPTIGGATIAVTGKITDAASGKPIEGATFYVLKVTVAEATQDGKLSADEVLAKGTSDRKGVFKLNVKLPRNQTYNVVVIANGYKTLAVDGAFEILPNDPDPVDLEVQLQKR